MGPTKESVLAEANEELNAEFEKESHRREFENRRENINNLVGIKYDTDRPGSYQEFKQAMQNIYKSKFERKYLRQLYRTYQAKWKQAQGK